MSDRLLKVMSYGTRFQHEEKVNIPTKFVRDSHSCTIGRLDKSACQACPLGRVGLTCTDIPDTRTSKLSRDYMYDNPEHLAQLEFRARPQ